MIPIPRKTHFAETTLTVNGRNKRFSATTLTVNGAANRFWWSLCDATGYLAGGNGYRTKQAAWEAGREAQDARLKTSRESSSRPLSI